MSMRQGLVIATMCLAGAVGAVTFDWTDANKVGTAFAGQGSSASNNALSALQVSNTNATTLFGAIVTGGYPGGNRVIFGVGNGESKDASNVSAISVSIGSGGTLSLWYNGTGLDNSNKGTQVGTTTATGVITANAEAKLILQLERTGASLTASLFVDGTDTALVSGTVSDFGSNTLDHLYVGDYYGAGGGGKYGAATSVQAYALPEPGVMALLALGVAGLALRRKAS